MLLTLFYFLCTLQDAVENALRRVGFLYMENSNTVEDFVREDSTSTWRFGEYPASVAQHGPHRQLGRMWIEIGSEAMGDGPVVHQRAYRAWDPDADIPPGLDSDFELMSNGQLHPPSTMYINMGKSNEYLYIGHPDKTYNTVTLAPFTIVVVKAHVPRGGKRFKTKPGEHMKRNPILIVELPCRHFTDEMCCRSYCEDDLTVYCPDVMIPYLPPGPREVRFDSLFQGMASVMQVGGTLSLALSGSLIKSGFSFNAANKFGYAPAMLEHHKQNALDDSAAGGDKEPTNENPNESSSDKETQDGADDKGSSTEDSAASTSTTTTGLNTNLAKQKKGSASEDSAGATSSSSGRVEVVPAPPMQKRAVPATVTLKTKKTVKDNSQSEVPEDERKMPAVEKNPLVLVDEAIVTVKPKQKKQEHEPDIVQRLFGEVPEPAGAIGSDEESFDDEPIAVMKKKNLKKTHSRKELMVKLLGEKKFTQQQTELELQTQVQEAMLAHGHKDKSMVSELEEITTAKAVDVLSPVTKKTSKGNKNNALVKRNSGRSTSRAVATGSPKRTSSRNKKTAAETIAESPERRSKRKKPDSSDFSASNFAKAGFPLKHNKKTKKASK
jgi:hypothetical protein